MNRTELALNATDIIIDLLGDISVWSAYNQDQQIEEIAKVYAITKSIRRAIKATVDSEEQEEQVRSELDETGMSEGGEYE